VLEGVCGAGMMRIMIAVPITMKLLTTSGSLLKCVPQNFTNGQLNTLNLEIGIPDILNEAAWGMEVWRKAQLDTEQREGGLRQQYPGILGPWYRYTALLPLSAATRESSLQYAAHASMLALAFKKAEQQD
jgi:hypothetical protein